MFFLCVCVCVCVFGAVLEKEGHARAHAHTPARGNTPHLDHHDVAEEQPVEGLPYPVLCLWFIFRVCARAPCASEGGCA